MPCTSNTDRNTLLVAWSRYLRVQSEIVKPIGESKPQKDELARYWTVGDFRP